VKQDSALDDERHSSYARGAEKNPSSTTYTRLYAEETQINDGGERNHDDEFFGYWIFKSAFSYSGQSGYYDFDYVNFGDVLDNALGDSNDAFVVSAWVRPTVLSSDQNAHGIKNCFISKDGNFEIGINESGYLQVYINASGVETTAHYGSYGSVGTNVWQFVAIRYNHSEVDVLIDHTWYRSAVGGTPEPWEGGGMLKSGGSFIVGAELTDHSCFTGRLDEVSVFNQTISDSEIEEYRDKVIPPKPLEITAIIKKEDGTGVWKSITTPGELIDGYINLWCEKTPNDDKIITLMEYYLTTTTPDIQNPNPENWILIRSFEYDIINYSYLLNSYSLPDNDSYYFIAKAVDNYENVTYDTYNLSEGLIPFAIEHFNTSMLFTYLDSGGRVNTNSYIGVIPSEDFEPYIDKLNLSVNYLGDSDYLFTYNYSDISSNYKLHGL